MSVTSRCLVCRTALEPAEGHDRDTICRGCWDAGRDEREMLASHLVPAEAWVRRVLGRATSEGAHPERDAAAVATGVLRPCGAGQLPLLPEVA